MESEADEGAGEATETLNTAEVLGATRGHHLLDGGVPLEMNIAVVEGEISTPTYLLPAADADQTMQDAVRPLHEGLLPFLLDLGRLPAGVVRTIVTLPHHEEMVEATRQAIRARLHRKGTEETESEAELSSAVKIEADTRHLQKCLAHFHLDHAESALLSHHAVVARHLVTAQSDDARLPDQFRRLAQGAE